MVLDVITEPLEDAYVGQTLKRSLGSSLSFEEKKRGRKEELSPVSKITLAVDVTFDEKASTDFSQQSNKSSSLQEGLLLLSDSYG